MCRLVTYLGTPILLEKVLVKPVNSIVSQSLSARESSIPTNGDGFGLGWYVPEIDWNPARFLSIFPAWNDRNLLNLTAKISSPCFFAHVRAASVGGINTYNCHPFVFGRWMLMHNGSIEGFISIKRHLRRLLDDDIYNWISGETDSEHLFALFLQLMKKKNVSSLTDCAMLLLETFQEIGRLLQQHGENCGPSFYNVCLTDGERLIASRFCTDPNTPQESLHYLAGAFTLPQDTSPHPQVYNAVITASEKLTDIDIGWEMVPESHFLLVDRDLSITLLPISYS